MGRAAQQQKTIETNSIAAVPAAVAAPQVPLRISDKEIKAICSEVNKEIKGWQPLADHKELSKQFNQGIEDAKNKLGGFLAGAVLGSEKRDLMQQKMDVISQNSEKIDEMLLCISDFAGAHIKDLEAFKVGVSDGSRLPAEFQTLVDDHAEESRALIGNVAERISLQGPKFAELVASYSEGKDPTMTIVKDFSDKEFEKLIQAIYMAVTSH